MSERVPLDELPRDLDALYAMHDALSDQLGKVEARIHALEENHGNPEERELRRDYYASR